MAINLISETPSLPTSPRISFSHDLCRKPGSVSTLEDYPFRWDSSLLRSSSDFDGTSENSSLLTSPRISFSHDLCHEDKSVLSIEDHHSDSLLLGFGSDIDLISENPSFPTSPRISFSHEDKSVSSVEYYQSDSLLLGFGSEIDLISENPSSPTSPRISFSHDLYHEHRSVPSIEDYQSDSLLLGFGSDIDLVSENPSLARTRSSDSSNIYSVSSLDYCSCSSDFDLISQTVGFSASPRSLVSHCICCSDSDSGFDFCITAKQHSSSANELFSDGRIQEKPLTSSELIPLSATVENSHNKSSLLSSLPVLLRSYSTGSLLGCKSLLAEMKSEFHF